MAAVRETRSNRQDAVAPENAVETARRHLMQPWPVAGSIGAEARALIGEGDGIYIVDGDGKRLIDGPAGMWCTNVGHRREELARVMYEQAMQLSYNTPWYTMNAPSAELARRIAVAAPGDLSHVFFTTGGSSAVETALRFMQFYNNARGRPEKKLILSRGGAYHGSTYLAASLNGRPRDRDWMDGAYFISFHGGRHKSLWLFLITIPFWTSYLLRVMSWKVILGYNGVLNSGLMGLGLISEPSTALLYNTSAVIITLTHAWAAFAILPIFVSLEKVDRTLIEAAKDLGDGPLRSFLRVTLPLSAPGVISALLIVMIPTVGDYVTPKLVGGKDGVMIANAIQAQFGKAANWPLGAALSVTTMVVVSLMAGAAVFLIRTAARLVR